MKKTTQLSKVNKAFIACLYALFFIFSCDLKETDFSDFKDRELVLSVNQDKYKSRFSWSGLKVLGLDKYILVQSIGQISENFTSIKQDSVFSSIDIKEIELNAFESKILPSSNVTYARLFAVIGDRRIASNQLQLNHNYLKVLDYEAISCEKCPSNYYLLNQKAQKFEEFDFNTLEKLSEEKNLSFINFTDKFDVFDVAGKKNLVLFQNSILRLSKLGENTSKTFVVSNFEDYLFLGKKLMVKKMFGLDAINFSSGIGVFEVGYPLQNSSFNLDGFLQKTTKDDEICFVNSTIIEKYKIPSSGSLVTVLQSKSINNFFSVNQFQFNNEGSNYLWPYSSPLIHDTNLTKVESSVNCLFCQGLAFDDKKNLVYTFNLSNNEPSLTVNSFPNFKELDNVIINGSILYFKVLEKGIFLSLTDFKGRIILYNIEMN